jgi:hypothetical protein
LPFASERYEQEQEIEEITEQVACNDDSKARAKAFDVKPQAVKISFSKRIIWYFHPQVPTTCTSLVCANNLTGCEQGCESFVQ